MFNKIQYFTLLAFCSVAYFLPMQNNLQAQNANETRFNSPYSRYGMGTMWDLNFTTSKMTSGAFSATFNNPNTINLQNPASLGSLRYTAFEASGYFQNTKLTENSASRELSSKSQDGNLSYFYLGFPITRTWEQAKVVDPNDSTKLTTTKRFPIQWGMAFSFSPYANVGYDVAIQRNLTDIGNVKFNYTGKGARYRLNWSNGFKYKDFSLGVNLGFVFGSVATTGVETFMDSTYNSYYSYSYQNTYSSKEYAKGLLVDIGAQQVFRFDAPQPKNPKRANSKWILKLGAMASLGTNLSTTTDQVYFRSGASTALYPVDTVSNETNIEGDIDLPIQTNIGAAFGREGRWLIGINHKFFNGKAYNNSRSTNALQNAHSFALGAEWTPMAENRDSYFQRVTYRLGAHYGQDGRYMLDTQSKIQALTKYGLSFGFTLPIETRLKSALSEIVVLSFGAAHMGFEFGYLGNSSFIKEKYFQFNVAITINDDGWFKRTKFR